MKKFLITSLMMFSICLSYAQSKFEIKKTGSQYTAEQITAAFSNSDFCGSHYENKSNTIVLNDGAEVVLLSKAKLLAIGVQLPASCFLTDNTHFIKAIWSISPEGHLLKGFDNSLYGTEKEYKRYNEEN